MTNNNNRDETQEDMHNEVHNISIEKVQETCLEFGRILFYNSKKSVFCIVDDTFLELIKAFSNTPYGMACARRWAIRLDDNDENSLQTFDQIREEYKAYLSE